jgi:3-oxoacyl-[acyl-carrier-protein] synthase-1
MLFLSRPALVSALGAGAAATSQALFAGEQAGLRAESGWLHDGVACVGRADVALPAIDTRFAARDSRNNRMLLAAYEQIADEVDAALRRHGKARVGVVLGTSTSGIDSGEAAIAAHRAQGRLPPAFHYEQMDIGDPAPFLAGFLGLEGPAYTVSTACTSSGKAIASAAGLIQAGLCDAVITGGVDTLCRLTINGFHSLEALSPEICNPLSRNRRGINIGEGAALFVLSRRPAEVALLGVGESSDAYHISSPEPDGGGAEAAMRAALRAAGLAPEDIGYLNLHATATAKNDEMESLAAARVFPEGVPCSGTKPLTGHALGAAGAIEAALCWLSLTDREGRLPPHCWDGEADPALPALDVTAPGRRFGSRRRIAMSNSFAFGGSNLALILGTP